MRKRIKALTSLGLVMCMMIGCGSQTETSKEATTGEKEQEKQQEASATNEVNEEETYPDYLNLDGYRPIVKEGEEITLKLAVMRSDHATNDWEDTWFVQFVEEELNINLEVDVFNGSLEEKKSLMLASGDLPDMMIGLQFNTNDIMKSGVEDGLLLPVSDYFSEELTPSILAALEGEDDAIALNTALDGKMYTVPKLNFIGPVSDAVLRKSRIFVDTKYMEAAGIEELPDTLDGFVDMLRKFKEVDAAESEGKIVPWASVDGLDKQFIQNAFGWITASDTYAAAAWDVETEEVVVPALTDKWKDYIEFYQTLYNEGLLHPDYFTMDTAAGRALFAERKTGVMGDWAPYLSRPEDFDEWVSMPALKSEWNEEGVSCVGVGYSLGTAFISADTEYPELCMRLLDYFYSPEGSSYCHNGPAAGTEDTLDMIHGYEIVDGKIKYTEIGQYESEFVYRMNFQLFEQNFYGRLANTVGFEMAGSEVVEKVADPTNADDNYRIKVIEATNGPLKTVLPSAYVSSDQLERYTDLQSIIKEYVRAEFAKFVTGQRPLSEYEEYQEELKGLGSEEYLEIIKSLYAKYEG